MDIDMIGPAAVMTMGCLGSAIGCGLPGMASHAVMSRVEEGHAKFIALAAIPASQSIYGLILMVMMKPAILSGSLSGIGGLGIGFFVGLVLIVASIYQGKCCVTAIQASAKQPAIYGKTLASIIIIETFSLFSFVFALLLI
ncbi:MAG: ATP synthase subunit C [Verrucomicrobiota bacterium]|nr:ATP synthase subunit C [Verrucomicrobiota bacterium]